MRIVEPGKQVEAADQPMRVETDILVQIELKLRHGEEADRFEWQFGVGVVATLILDATKTALRPYFGLAIASSAIETRCAH
jgi:hypothetical protein